MPANLPALFGSDRDVEPAQPTFVGKVVLWIASIVGLSLMLWLARTFSIPTQPGFSVSLLQQHGWFISTFVVIVAIFAVMFVSAALCTLLRSDAAVFCTALACVAISCRGGTMQSTLMAAAGSSVFLGLAFEVVILFSAMVGAWMLLQRVRSSSSAILPPPSEETVEEEGIDERLLATFTQASAMMAIMILLCRSDAKNQSLASVAIASAAGAAIAVQLVNVRSSFWLWIGPLAVALFGYLFAALHAEGWQTGLLHGPLSALARPLPLDYVSMGPAGAIFGYWLSTGGETEEMPSAVAT